MIPAGDERTSIVLLNSLATRASLWDGVRHALPDDVDAVTFDQRDQRHSDDAAPFALDDMVDDAVAALDERGIARAHVAGVSLGGIAALHAAATRPDRFLTVTAMCCAARFPRDVWTERAATVREGGLAPLVPAVLNRWFTAAFQDAHPALVGRFAAMLAATPDDGYARACDLLAEADVSVELSRIEQPALIVSGELDTANPVEHQRRIVDGIPRASHTIVPDAGHLVPASHPDTVARLLIEQLRAS